VNDAETAVAYRWAVAARLREGGGTPIKIQSDETVF
jgi:hypothetical protein